MKSYHDCVREKDTVFRKEGRKEMGCRRLFANDDDDDDEIQKTDAGRTDRFGNFRIKFE